MLHSKSVSFAPLRLGRWQLDDEPAALADFALHGDAAAVRLDNVLYDAEPDADNRGMEISAESEDFFRSSFVSLEGDKAPSVTELAFKGLPGGDYQVSVALIGSRGVRKVVSRKVTIIASAMDR